MAKIDGMRAGFRSP